MFEVYDKWPEIAHKSFESKQEMVSYDNINHIVFAGMGGSGTVGDIFSSILSKSKIHVNVVKGYVLPKTSNSNTLVVVISVSGNTAETLSVLESAQKMNCKIICFTSGGKMLDFCKKNKNQYRIISKIHSPRASFINYLYSILKVLHVTLEINQKDILESITELEKIHTKINSSNLTNSNVALNLAKWITNTPMIYYPFGLQSVGIRFKNSLNENSKIHASTEDMLEACHNGVVAWEKKSTIQPILIEGEDDHIKTKERWQALKKLLSQNNVEYKEIKSVKGGILSKLVNLVYLLDYTTIYLAIKFNIDPTPVKSIEFIKKNIS
ncbi:MAG: glucose-6-phosphate isomerase [Thaumarchaeota archaeon]|jgi:glucose/mannose-6-phosphate isomerase|nr:MAG: glucose-6-phosphate isomerase [Nitrososphaerota archaeon]